MPSKTPSDPAPSADRRHLRRDRTRAQLIGAAREVMGRLGADGTTISAITKAAGVGKGSFYNHFSSKEALVEAVMDDSIGLFADQILSLTDTIDDDAEVLATSIRHFLAMATGDAQVGRFLVRGAAGRTLVEARIGPWVRRDVEAGLNSGRFRCDDLEIFGSMLAGSAESVIRGMLDGRLGEDSAAKLAASLLRLLGVEEADANQLCEKALAPIPDARDNAA